MGVTLEDIKSTAWQMSIKNPGGVTQGLNDVRQCVQIILTTTQGSDPLRPLFGSNIYQHIDKPVTIAAPLICAEILDCIGKWEQRITIQRLVYDIIGHRIEFFLFAELVDSNESTELLFYIDKQQPEQTDDTGAFSNGFSFGFS